jgi:hypothetical protein
MPTSGMYGWTPPKKKVNQMQVFLNRKCGGKRR